MQGNDVDNIPDIIPGKIFFENVVFSEEIESFLKKINSSNNIDTEVQKNTFEISDEFLRLYLFVCVFDYKKDTQDYLCLDILSTSCKWKTEVK